MHAPLEGSRSFRWPTRGFPPFRPAVRRRTFARQSARREAGIDIFLDTILLTVGGLLPIINPFSTAPLFVSLTARYDPAKRSREAMLACLYAFAILVTFLLVGSAIIEFFGISVPGIRVAGGLIISVNGFRMLFPAPKVPGGPIVDEDETSVAFSPIAMPSLAGPGSITVVLAAAGQIRSIRPEDWRLIYVAVILGMAAVLLFSLLVLRAASAVVRFLGPAGLDAMTRIFGFLLICLGMQFLLSGVADFYGLMKP